jgi:hypothetical protein
MGPQDIILILQAMAALAAEIPEIQAGITTVIDLIGSGAAPTAEQQASIDALLNAANAKLQGTAPPTPAA